MKTLPPCPHCDANDDTLGVFHTDAKGRRWCECNCCAKESVVNEDGEIVPDIVRDDW